jgi:plasmid stabilization system protein ParE
MTFSVRTLPRADADIGHITSYIYERSPQGAAAWINALDLARARLADNAEGCGEADENEHFDIKVQQALFKTRRGRVYRMLFTIIDEEVRILRVRGPGQAPVQSDDFPDLQSP